MKKQSRAVSLLALAAILFFGGMAVHRAWQVDALSAENAVYRRFFRSSGKMAQECYSKVEEVKVLIAKCDARATRAMGTANRAQTQALTAIESCKKKRSYFSRVLRQLKNIIKQLPPSVRPKIKIDMKDLPFTG